MPQNRNDDPDRDRGKDEILRQRVMALVAPLPARKVYDLLRQVGRLAFPGQTNRLEIVKLTVVEYLNRRRPQRARRLFTELFEPILVGDPVLLRAKRMIPGMLQRVDAAGLWGALGRTAFAKTADTVQRRLDEMAETEVLEDVFHEPEVQTLRQHLREQAVEIITKYLKDRRQLPEFLESINRRRLSEAREQVLYLDAVAPVDPHFLQFVIEYLSAGDACISVLNECFLNEHSGVQFAAVEPGADTESEAERVAAKLHRAARVLHESVVTPQTRSELGQLAPLAALNVGRQYRAVALYVRESGFQGAADDVFVVEALMAHFAACCAAVSTMFMSVLKLDTRLPGASIRFTAREVAELEEAMRRLARMIPALITAGLLENRVTEPVYRQIWQELARFIAERLLPVLMQRLTVAMVQRTGLSVDHKDVVWLLRLIWDWHQMGRSHDQAFGVFDKWREHLQVDMELAVTKAVRFEDGEALAERLDHLLRLNEIAMVFNLRIAHYLSVSSQNVARMMTYSLDQHLEMPVDERELVVDYLGLVRAEIARSRNWRSAELADLLRLAEARGL